MENTVVWFDLPVSDLGRAIKFYSEVLKVEIQEMEQEMNGCKFAMFPFAPNTPSGSLVQGPENEPSTKGSVIYLNGGNDLAGPLSRVESAGGKIVLEKTSLGPNGFMAKFTDTEGNLVALHSPN